MITSRSAARRDVGGLSGGCVEPDAEVEVLAEREVRHAAREAQGVAAARRPGRVRNPTCGTQQSIVKARHDGMTGMAGMALEWPKPSPAPCWHRLLTEVEAGVGVELLQAARRRTAQRGPVVHAERSLLPASVGNKKLHSDQTPAFLARGSS